jgi:hypothetical protein
MESSNCRQHFVIVLPSMLKVLNRDPSMVQSRIRLSGEASQALAKCQAILRFYNKRGTAEQWIKEGKQVVKMTRLSCLAFGRTKCSSGG